MLLIIAIFIELQIYITDLCGRVYVDKKGVSIASTVSRQTSLKFTARETIRVNGAI